MRAHYHVTYQTVGCLPDYDEIAFTRREAESLARAWADEERDAGNPVRGSARSGRYDVRGCNVILIEPCVDDCGCTE